jgi:hypothetical protein
MPDEWPAYFPAKLRVRAEVVLGDACEKFPRQKQLLPFCLYVITELTPDFRRWLPDRMPERVRNFMRDYVLSANCEIPHEVDKLLQEIRRSPEFRALVREAVVLPTPDLPVINNALASVEKLANGKLAEVEALIKTTHNAGFPINRVDILIAVGRFKDPRSLQRYAHHIDQCHPDAINAFNWVVTLIPADFMKEHARHLPRYEEYCRSKGELKEADRARALHNSRISPHPPVQPANAKGLKAKR